MAEQKYLELEDLKSYISAFELSNKIWEMILKWAYFQKDTIGKQLVRAVDSISTNIAEGFGRYTKKDKIRFYYYAYGSTLETIDWINKSYHRDLISSENRNVIINELDTIKIQIHSLIRYTNSKLKY
jgi:four helix bundle protein